MIKQVSVAILTLVFLLFSQAAGTTKNGGMTPLFSTGAGGRALGMGGANSALANDASGIFWNPATLTTLQDRSISLMYLPLSDGTNYSFAAVAWPTVDYGTFSLASFLVSTNQIERRDDNGRLLGEFSANQQMFLLGYGKQINHFLAVGANIKLYGQSLDNTSSFGAGADLGARLILTQNFSFGINAQNLIKPQTRLYQEKESLPRNIKTGLGATFPLSAGRTRLSFEADLDKTDKVNPVFHFGGELGFMNNYFLRAGYDVDQVNLGAGVHVGPATISYTYRTQDYFSAQHRISLDLTFGGSITSILARREQDKQKAAEQLAKENRERDLITAQTQARYFFQSGLYDSAEVYYQKVRVLTGGTDEEASSRLAELQKQKTDQITAKVRAGVLAESDSLKAQELLRELGEALQLKDLEAASILLGRLRPAFGNDDRFKQREAEYSLQVSDKIANLQKEGALLSNQGKLAEAALAYDQILQLNENDNVAKRNLKQIDERISSLSQLRSGVNSYRSGDTAQALETLQRLVAINPNDSVAIMLLQMIEPPIGSQASSSLAQIQGNPEVWKTYLDGIEKFRDKNYQQAINLWGQVLKVYPGNAETEKNIQQAKLRLQTKGSTD